MWIIDSTVAGNRRVNEKEEAEKYQEIASKCGKGICSDASSGWCARYHTKRSGKVLEHDKNEQDPSRTS